MMCSEHNQQNYADTQNRIDSKSLVREKLDSNSIIDYELMTISF